MREETESGCVVSCWLGNGRNAPTGLGWGASEEGQILKKLTNCGGERQTGKVDICTRRGPKANADGEEKDDFSISHEEGKKGPAEGGRRRTLDKGSAAKERGGRCWVWLAGRERKERGRAALAGWRGPWAGACTRSANSANKATPSGTGGPPQSRSPAPKTLQRPRLLYHHLLQHPQCYSAFILHTYIPTYTHVYAVSYCPP